MKQLPILIAGVLLLGAEPVRFDHKVRDLYFEAFAGDKEALPKAMAITEVTLRENPNHAEAHYQLGMALVNEGNMAGAATEFETYVRLSPEGPNAATAKSLVAQLKK